MNEVFTDYITAEEYMEFRKAVGWAEFPLEEAAEGLKNSFICCLRKDGKAIALGRIVSDRGYVAYIADIIVLPEYQGNGYGRMVMENVMSMINSWLKPGYKMMVSLCSATDLIATSTLYNHSSLLEASIIFPFSSSLVAP